MVKKTRQDLTRQLALVLLVVSALGGGLLVGRALKQGQGFQLPESSSFQGSSVTITYITRYQKCDDTATVSEDIAHGGLEEFLASLSQDWRAVGDNSRTVQLMRVLDDWCPTHRNYRYIKLHRGNVVVFRGKAADDRFIVDDLKHLKESAITHQETLTLLKQGVLLFDENPDNLDRLVRSYLEGITD